MIGTVTQLVSNVQTWAAYRCAKLPFTIVATIISLSQSVITAGLLNKVSHAQLC